MQHKQHIIKMQHLNILMLIVFAIHLFYLCRHQSKTPPPKRKSRFQSRSRSESPEPEQTSKAEVIPDVVKSCDLSGSETTQKNHVR